MTTPTELPAALEWPPAMTPERQDYIRRAILAVSTTLVDMMLTDLAAPSTDSLSTSERLMVGTMRPFLPRLRAAFLGKLSESDPASLERLMGATATALEQILAQAPGEPLPRWAWVWNGTAYELVPDRG